MHLRLRPSPTDPTMKRVFAVRADGEEVPDPASQKRWDDEQLSQQTSSNPDNNSQHTCFIQHLPRSVLFPHTPSNFVVEFMDWSCKFIFMIHGGGAQWYFKNTSTEACFENGIYKLTLPPGFETHESPFFSEDLVSIPQSTFKNLAALWEGRLNTGWICNDTTNHNHYLLKIVVGLAEDGSIPNSKDLKHTLHMVCENTDLKALFDGLCKHKLNDSFSMTWLWDYQTDDGSYMVVVGPAYTYFMARYMQLQVKDLGWGDHRNRINTSWVLPLPSVGGFSGKLNTSGAYQGSGVAECNLS